LPDHGVGRRPTNKQANGPRVVFNYYRSSKRDMKGMAPASVALSVVGLAITAVALVFAVLAYISARSANEKLGRVHMLSRQFSTAVNPEVSLTPLPKYDQYREDKG
jgi:hypothetical protein